MADIDRRGLLPELFTYPLCSAASSLIASLIFVNLTVEMILSMACTEGVLQPHGNAHNATTLLMQYSPQFPNFLSGQTFYPSLWCELNPDDSQSHADPKTLAIDHLSTATAYAYPIILALVFIYSIGSAFFHLIGANFVNANQIAAFGKVNAYIRRSLDLLLTVISCFALRLILVIRPESIKSQFDFCDANNNKHGVCSTESYGSYGFLVLCPILSLIVPVWRYSPLVIKPIVVLAQTVWFKSVQLITESFRRKNVGTQYTNIPMSAAFNGNSNRVHFNGGIQSVNEIEV